jgi:hypothetical protein
VKLELRAMTNGERIETRRDNMAMGCRFISAIPRRTSSNNLVFDAIKIRPVFLPVVWIPLDDDVFVRLEFDELEGTCANRMLTHVAGRDVARIDGRVSGSEQREQCRLRRFR